jgi:hypothetical protein
VTNQDYELIAKAIKLRYTDTQGTEISAAYQRGVGYAAHSIACSLEGDCKGFDKFKFLKACGLYA